MSIKSKVLAVAAVMTMAGSLDAVGPLAANGATPSCRTSCSDIFSYEFSTHSNPDYVLDVLGQEAKAGQPIILLAASKYDKGEDFTASNQGTVADIYKAGLVTPVLDQHYPALSVLEIKYSPDGSGSGLCVGVGSTAVDGTPVALEPCGVSARTLWVVDSHDSISGGYVPLINGSDTSFPDPYVLHYPGSAAPKDLPRPQLNTYALQRYPNKHVFVNEIWGSDYGVLP